MTINNINDTLNDLFLEELNKTISSIDTHKINVLILTNLDEKTLSSEITLKNNEKKIFYKKANDILKKLETFPIPVISVLDGYISGILFEISLCCDIRICSNNTIFGNPLEGHSQRLSRIVGVGMAKQLIYTKMNIEANEAYRIGLINSFYLRKDLLKNAKKLAQMIINNSQKAIKNSKKAINEGIQYDLDKGIQIETKLFGDCFETSEQRSKMQNFLKQTDNKEHKSVIIKFPNKLPSRKNKWYIFLAGPILGAPEWQDNIPNISDEIIWLSPRGGDNYHFTYEELIDWESNCLRMADIILFWIPEPIKIIEGKDYAQTTRTEFGEYLARGKKVIIGVNNKFPGRMYFEIKSKQYGIKKIHNNINDCLIEIKEYINKFKSNQVFFTSDTHFGSEKAMNFSLRPFKTVEEMNWKLIENWNKVVHPNDIVYHLGDFGDLWPIQYLNGKIILIEGNVDKNEIEKNSEYKSKLKNYFEKIYENPIINEDLEYGKKILCHEPLEGLKLYNSIKYENNLKYKDINFILFGHIHGRQKFKVFGMDVGMDANNYFPISEKDVEYYRKDLKKDEKYNSHVFCNINSKNINKKHKVFLGGTCDNSTWRDELIKLLKIDYFNPVVDHWTESCQEEEDKQKDIECDLQLYVITPEMKGLFSIAELTEAAINMGERCIVCILDSKNQFDKKKRKSLDAIIKLVKKYRAKYFDNLIDVANYLNSFN